MKRAIALGIFDGIHRGHADVIRRACRVQGTEPCIFTFITETIPFKQGRQIEYIYSEKHKEKILRERTGGCMIYSADYNEIKDMDGETFCREILLGKLSAARVFCGREFRFGKGAAWGFDDLAAFGEKYGFRAEAVSPVTDEGARISSTRIRGLLRKREAAEAGFLLGAPYEIYGEVKYGKQLGRTIDFPTINQYFEKGQLVPGYGVYASGLEIDGKKYRAVTNIGIRPTVDSSSVPSAETHILDGFSGDLYGRTLTVKLFAGLREERRFSDISELKKAIENDIKHCLERQDRQWERRI